MWTGGRRVWAYKKSVSEGCPHYHARPLQYFGETEPNLPGLLFPCTCQWGCYEAASTAAGPWLATAWASAAGRLLPAVSDMLHKQAGFLAAGCTECRRSVYSRSRYTVNYRVKKKNKVKNIWDFSGLRLWLTGKLVHSKKGGWINHGFLGNNSSGKYFYSPMKT